MSQIGGGSLNFRLAIGEMNFSKYIYGPISKSTDHREISAKPEGQIC